MIFQWLGKIQYAVKYTVEVSENKLKNQPNKNIDLVNSNLKKIKENFF